MICHDCGGEKRRIRRYRRNAEGDQPGFSFSDNVPRPEMWTPESVVQAVKDGFTFLIPFIWEKGKRSGYYIRGKQYICTGVTVGPEHTEIIRMTPEGWIEMSLWFPPYMVPEDAFIGEINENGVGQVLALVDPSEINWDQLNRGTQIRVPKILRRRNLYRRNTIHESRLLGSLTLGIWGGGDETEAEAAAQMAIKLLGKSDANDLPDIRRIFTKVQDKAEEQPDSSIKLRAIWEEAARQNAAFSDVSFGDITGVRPSPTSKKTTRKKATKKKTTKKKSTKKKTTKKKTTKKATRTRRSRRTTVCIMEGCVINSYGKPLCRRHYCETVGRPFIEVCQHPGCEEPSFGKPLCRAHYYEGRGRRSRRRRRPGHRNYRRNAKEEAHISSEEFDALNAQEQLDYMASTFFLKKPPGYRLTFREYKRDWDDPKVKPKFSLEELRTIKGELRSQFVDYTPDWAKKIRDKHISGGYGPVDSSEAQRSYLREIKIEWNKRADRNFFGKFVYVHYFLRPEWLEHVLTGGMGSSAEISTIGYLKDGGVVGRVWGGDKSVGVVVEGYITLAGNADLQVSQWIPETGPKAVRADQKYTGELKQLFTDEKGFRRESIDEALIDNWKITAIVLPHNKIPKEFEKLVNESNLPILNSKFEVIRNRRLRRYRRNTVFWGKEGAGILPIAKSTGRILVGLRSRYVNEPLTWGVFGGKIDSGEDPEEAAIREMQEELRYKGPVKLIPGYGFTSSNFTYHNFIGLVDDEFEVTPKDLNWETDETKWITLRELRELDNKHFGLEAFLNNSSALIERVVSKYDQ